MTQYRVVKVKSHSGKLLHYEVERLHIGFFRNKWEVIRGLVGPIEFYLQNEAEEWVDRQNERREVVVIGPSEP